MLDLLFCFFNKYNLLRMWASFRQTHLDNTHGSPLGAALLCSHVFAVPRNFNWPCRPPTWRLHARQHPPRLLGAPARLAARRATGGGRGGAPAGAVRCRTCLHDVKRRSGAALAAACVRGAGIALSRVSLAGRRRLTGSLLPMLAPASCPAPLVLPAES